MYENIYRTAILIYVKSLLKTKWVYMMLAILLIGVVLFSLVRTLTKKPPEWVTETVVRGEVANIVSVSGVVKAEDTAELAFPTTGIVSEVLVREGDTVTKDQILATLEQSELQAERHDAQASLLIAEADRDELMNGPRSEERDVTDITVQIAEENLARTITEEAEKVGNARRTLLSSNLEAFPVDSKTDDVPPTITGTYSCGTEGIYTLALFNSNARSGYSYRLSGLESGTYTAYTESPAPLGTCGLFIQFDENEIYASKSWEVAIPNKRSATYATNVNTYNLALKQEENNVSAARQALLKAQSEQVLENADPREEALTRANANVLQARARLAQVDARINDRTLRAPFDGVINNIDVIRGETVGTLSAMTIVADDIFELTVRIPEIDITKINVGQPAEVIFDARADETIPSSIGFISPLATEIDGVAYFEAKLRFDTPPTWLRGGLNADVNIITERKSDVLRIPKRFLIEENGSYSVLLPQGDTTSKTPINVGFIGNDGFVEITGLSEGTSVIAP